MSELEKRNATSMVKIKNCKLSSGGAMARARQQGSILIGLIITMVIMAALGAGMIYLTTTSTFQELLANNNTRAYYVAESGARYTNALIRQALATGSLTLTQVYDSYFKNKILKLANGDSFEITNWTMTPDVIGSWVVDYNITGTVGSGFMQAKRKLAYKINPANQNAGTSGVTTPENTIPLTSLVVSTGAIQTAIVTVGGDQAIQVVKTQGEGGAPSQEAYVLPPPVTPNPMWLNWGGSGDFSSYDLQVKVATGTLATATGTLSGPIDYYCMGLCFRSVATPSTMQYTFFGVSIMRSAPKADGIEDNMTPPAGTPPSWENWAPGRDYNLTDNKYVLYNGKYYECLLAHRSTDTPADKKIPNDTNSLYWKLFSNNDKPMIVFWRRSNNAANGDDAWLAYKLLDKAGGDIIVDSAGHIKDWSTILVRVVEAASVKLQAATPPCDPGINNGAIIAGNTGHAKVFRRINETPSNGGNVVLLLNNMTADFTFPTNVTGPLGTCNVVSTRDRDNYIWAFYGDTGDHGSDTTPLGNTRLADHRIVDPTDPNDKLNWPVADISNWPQANDYFTLVQWNSTLNTAQATYKVAGVQQLAELYLMGSGYELNAIIRTNMWTRPGPYDTSSSFPAEIGINSLGAQAQLKTYFDDLAYYLTGGGGGGGTDGSGAVVQYP